MDTIFNIGIEWIEAIQNLGEWLVLPMSIITFLGSEEFFLLILPALYWSIDSAIGIRVGVILLVTGAVNNALKLAFHGPRPYWVNTQVKAYAAESSFGAPSGHSQTAVGVWGMLAQGIRRWWGWLVAVLLVLLIGFSRLFLAVHFPHDVFLGWMIGVIVLGITLGLWNPVVRWLKKRSVIFQILIAFVFSLLLIILSLPGHYWLQENWQLPVEWANNAAAAYPGSDPINPISLDGTLTNAGSFFGLAAGLALLISFGGFDASGPVWKRILRYVVGAVGVLAIRYGLKAIFPEGETLIANILHYFRYSLVGLWVSFGAPFTFFWMGLADRKRTSLS